uniref:Uncharacterized protein n=1 Tax=Sipha flava TaxID=143950 RepID=A0A2S2Q750_9HEMI
MVYGSAFEYTARDNVIIVFQIPCAAFSVYTNRSKNLTGSNDGREQYRTQRGSRGFSVVGQKSDGENGRARPEKTVSACRDARGMVYRRGKALELRLPRAPGTRQILTTGYRCAVDDGVTDRRAWPDCNGADTTTRLHGVTDNNVTSCVRVCVRLRAPCNVAAMTTPRTRPHLHPNSLQRY